MSYSYEMGRLETLANQVQEKVERNINFQKLDAKYVRITIEAEFSHRESASITRLVEQDGSYDY